MDSNKFLSVIICTFNPNIKRLEQTLEGLAAQTLAQNSWELIIVDNNSTINFESNTLFPPSLDFKIVKEKRQGLTFARLRGFLESKGQLILMVDDDNIVEKDYLREVASIFSNNAALGAIGGKSLPLFEQTPPSWIGLFYGSLALRDLGEEAIVTKWEGSYPNTAPIGAGMAIRKEALERYITKIQSGQSAITDRKGTSLSSGGDNDIVIEILKDGWDVGYYPSLSLTHIIPKERITPQYLAKLVRDSNESWVKLLASHQMNPWKKIPKRTLIARKLKAWVVYKAWKNELNYIQWSGACGTYKGLSEV